jgi:hypothetical protein
MVIDATWKAGKGKTKVFSPSEERVLQIIIRESIMCDNRRC